MQIVSNASSYSRRQHFQDQYKPYISRLVTVINLLLDEAEHEGTLLISDYKVAPQPQEAVQITNNMKEIFSELRVAYTGQIVSSSVIKQGLLLMLQPKKIKFQVYTPSGIRIIAGYEDCHAYMENVSYEKFKQKLFTHISAEYCPYISYHLGNHELGQEAYKVTRVKESMLPVCLTDYNP